MYQLSKKLEQFALLILLIPIFIFGKLTKGNSRANILKRSQNNEYIAEKLSLIRKKVKIQVSFHFYRYLSSSLCL